ncbi:hypothetical protein JXA40_10835 [bacterium]|nr:hypothetical protein [candidate division CSSED10-310 bacterium]
MRFTELKTVADIRERYQHLERKLRDIQSRAVIVMAEIKAEIVISTLNDFRKYFEEKDFVVRTGEQEAEAVYKCVSIMLNIQEPGRREEDIPCLLRFKLTVSASEPEGFSIYVRWEESPSPARTELPVNQEKLAGGTGQMIQALTRLIELTGDLMDYTRRVSTGFQVRSNLSVLEKIQGDTESLSSLLHAETAKWTALQMNRFMYWIHPGHEDTTPEQQFTSFLELLKHLDGID